MDSRREVPPQSEGKNNDLRCTSTIGFSSVALSSEAKYSRSTIEGLWLV